MAIAKIDNIGGSANLVDANPNLLPANTTAGMQNAENFVLFAVGNSKLGNFQGLNKILVCGYKKIKAWTEVPSWITSYQFQYKDNTMSAEIPSVNGWTDWIDIPKNAMYFIANGTYSGGGGYYANIGLSLKA